LGVFAIDVMARDMFEKHCESYTAKSLLNSSNVHTLIILSLIRYQWLHLHYGLGAAARMMRKVQHHYLSEVIGRLHSGLQGSETVTERINTKHLFTQRA